MGKPIFENKVVEENEKDCMWFPSRRDTNMYMNYLPSACSSSGQLLSVEDENGTPRPLTCEIKKGKMCFTKGWSEFYNARKIVRGDKISFYKEDESSGSGAPYTIKVMKN